MPNEFQNWDGDSILKFEHVFANISLLNMKIHDCICICKLAPHPSSYLFFHLQLLMLLYVKVEDVNTVFFAFVCLIFLSSPATGAFVN